MWFDSEIDSHIVQFAGTAVASSISGIVIKSRLYRY